MGGTVVDWLVHPPHNAEAVGSIDQISNPIADVG